MSKKKYEAFRKRKAEEILHDKGITESFKSPGPSYMGSDSKKLNDAVEAELDKFEAERKKEHESYTSKSDKNLKGRTKADAKVEDVSADPEKVSNVMALLKRNKESNEPSPEAADQIEPKEGKKEEGGFWSGVGKSFSGENLGEALAYFSPDIIGGILGYALGGNRGALEGLQHANKLRLGVDEQRRKDREFNLKKLKAMGIIGGGKSKQQSEWMMRMPDGTSVPTVFNPNTGQYEANVNGTWGNAEFHKGQLENQKNVRQGIGFQNKLALMNRQQQQQVLRKYTDTVAPYKLVTGSAQSLIDKFNEDGGETAKTYLGSFGVGKTMRFIVNQFSGKDPKGSPRLKFMSELFNEAGHLQKDYVRALSGTAYSDKELATVEKLLPNDGDTPAQFMWKAQTLQKVYQKKIDIMKNHYGNTAKIKKELNLLYGNAEKDLTKKGYKPTTGVNLKKLIKEEESRNKNKKIKYNGKFGNLLQGK